MKKVVSERRASLDDETEVEPAIRKWVEAEFERGASIPVVPPPASMVIPDVPRLILVIGRAKPVPLLRRDIPEKQRFFASCFPRTCPETERA